MRWWSTSVNEAACGSHCGGGWDLSQGPAGWIQAQASAHWRLLSASDRGGQTSRFESSADGRPTVDAGARQTGHHGARLGEENDLPWPDGSKLGAAAIGGGKPCSWLGGFVLAAEEGTEVFFAFWQRRLDVFCIGSCEQFRGQGLVILCSSLTSRFYMNEAIPGWGGGGGGVSAVSLAGAATSINFVFANI